MSKNIAGLAKYKREIAGLIEGGGGDICVDILRFIRKTCRFSNLRDC